MITQITVVCEESGTPLAWIPNEHVWGIVEFLSFHRVRVSYNYDCERFTVRFHQSDAAVAQALLDDWVKTSGHLEKAVA